MRKQIGKILLIVVNDPGFFLSHRLPLAIGVRNEGFDVHIATMGGVAVKDIEQLGFTHHVVRMSRSSQNPIRELITFISLLRLIRRLRPDLVHLVTIKPVLYGGVAARLANVPAVVAAVSGLGFAFLAKGFKASMVRFCIKSLYRVAFGKKNLRVVFQNRDDCKYFLEIGVVAPQKCVLIKGSGVDLASYPVIAEPDGLPIVIMASRLLRDKGAGEFVQAAQIVSKRGVKARFLLVGETDPQNPSSVTTTELENLKKEGCVEILGYRRDIPDLFASSNIIVLPSYREGLPKVLVEAAAAGRAVVTTDVPGCRDAIEPDVTGLLVPVRDAHALADAIQHLIEDTDLRQRMGKEGRRLAKNEFSIEKVVQAHLDMYRALVASA